MAIVQRDISRSTALTTAAVHGQSASAGTSTGVDNEEQLVNASRMAQDAQIALASGWNQSVDAVFNPIIRELHKRGW